MSCYASLGGTGQNIVTEQLYKTLLVFPCGKVGQSLQSEMAGTSRPNIFPNQIFRQKIPSPEPQQQHIQCLFFSYRKLYLNIVL
jgi:hypothetical protein